MTDYFLNHQLAQLKQSVELLRGRVNMPYPPVAMDEETRKRWEASEAESKKAWGIPVFVAMCIGVLLVAIEAVAAAILTWLYVGSDKGLTFALVDGPKAVGLHWDPFIAVGLSVVAAIAWFGLLAVPLLGPLAALAASAVWGVALYGGTGSLAFGLFVFAVSLLARMFMRKTRWRWLSAAEWGLLVVAAVVALAPFGTRPDVPGLGGWKALLQVHHTQTCDKELRRGAWKGRHDGNAAFYAARSACVSQKSRG